MIEDLLVEITCPISVGDEWWREMAGEGERVHIAGAEDYAVNVFFDLTVLEDDSAFLDN